VMALAAVTGLKAEARLLERRGIAAVATGGRDRRTESVCERLLAGGASALLSFGIAGALAPGLAPGTLLLPRVVRDENGSSIAADADWRVRIKAALVSAVDERDVLGRPVIAATAAEKVALFRATGAVAVDLESHIVAAAARRAGRPFLVVRAVADPAHDTLPHAATVGLDEEGRALLAPVLRSLLAHPMQVAALVRLARDTRAALRALARAADAL